MKTHDMLVVSALLVAAAAAGCARSSTDEGEPVATAEQNWHKHEKGGNYNSGSYNLQLEARVRFNPLQPGANATSGRALFGVHPADDNLEDKSGALFEGFSVASQKNIVSNQRTCFSCHRGADMRFGLGSSFPLSSHIDPGDALFTGVDADAQGDPDALDNLDNLGLIKYRPNRFNLQRSQDDPYRKVFFWHKSPTLINVAFSQGFLMDGRARVMFETDRGAVFSHTQNEDDRFDDLFSEQQGADLEAFQFGLVSDPVLLVLRDPNHPDHEKLVNDPFYTVPVHTKAQKRGRKVFERYCMSCHNTPNVFNSLDNVEALGPDQAVRPVTFPGFAPSVGRSFDVGVSERNKHGLRFTVPDGVGGFETVVLPLAKEDGSTVMLPVGIDIGLAATTARYEDVGRFKVPQLRGVKDNAPYFHDNSASTLEEVVDYFDSPAYNHSKDGKRYPIHMNHHQRADLLEFLKIL